MESTRKLENDLKCEICEKTFQSNERKRKHFGTTHGETNIFTCNVCNRIFGTKNGLTFHLKNYHQEAPRKFKCDSCGKSFYQSVHLKNHIKKIHERQR